MHSTRKKKTQKNIQQPLVKKLDHNNECNEEIINDFKDEEIFKLQEEIRLLKIENATLRNNLEQINSALESSSHKARDSGINTPVKPRRNSTALTKMKEKGCSCTGSCANKKCGCVKRDIECSEFCKCSNSCQNQVANVNEDKENQDIQITSNTSKNNTSKRSNRLIPESEDKNPMNDTDKGLRNSSCSSNASTQTDDDEESNLLQPKVNPMKPTHQLPRSPLQKQKESPDSSGNTTNATIFNDDDVFLPVPKIEAEEEFPLPDEMNQMEVDWDEHQAKLVTCGKCKRKFHPYRIKKHERSCIKI